MIGDYLTGAQLVERWKCAPFDIFKKVLDGLPCYCDYEGELQQYPVAQVERGYSKKGAGPLMHSVFKLEDILPFEEKTAEPAGKQLSAFALSQSEVFKEVVPAIIELGIFCYQNQPVKKADATQAIFMNHPVLTDNLWNAIWRAVPDEFKRKRGESDRNLKSTK